MKTLLIIGGFILCVAVVYVLSNYFTLIKTSFLILLAEPYEQSSSTSKTILIIGDSTGYGTGTYESKNSIAGRIGADFPSYTIKNWSKNSDTIAEAYHRVREQGLTESYELILLQLGANDIIQKKDVSESRDDLQALYEYIQPHTDHIVMMSAGNVGAVPVFTGEEADYYTEHSIRFHTMAEAFAVSHTDFTYLNLYQAPREDPFVLEPEKHVALDGLHPTAAGYRVWYDSLRPILENELQ